MKKSVTVLLVLFLLAALTAGCGTADTPAQEETQAETVLITETPTEIPTEAPTEVPTTTPPTEPTDPMLGKWLGIYMDMEGLKMPMGKDQGFAIDFILEEGGKATYLLYLSSEGEVDEATVSADWSGNADGFEIHSDDKDMPGTFQCSIKNGVLIVQDLLGENTTFKMAKEGSPEVELLREEAQLMQDILDAMDAETAETEAP